MVRLSPSAVGAGTALFHAGAEQKMEGVVAKKLSSRYLPGERSRDWLEIKTSFDVDVVVVDGRRVPGSGKGRWARW